jgi:hypothetical protein
MNEQTTFAEKVRCYLGIIITIAGILGVTIIAIVIMIVAETGKKSETAQFLLTSLLPVIGTWVGTVLAYYFAKENFESAARTTKELAGIDERLRSVPVTTAMIEIGKADKLQLKKSQDPESLKLKDLIDQMTKAKRQRLPVLDEKGAPVYIIHLSSLTDFVARQALGAAGAAVAGLTIADLKNQRADLFRMIGAWACVKRTATLADAKQTMDALRNCSDVFVTESGRIDEPVIGWVTNAEIALHSKA